MSLKNIKKKIEQIEMLQPISNYNQLLLEVAEMVRSERLKRGLTQGELAKMIASQQTSIARLESGNFLPSLSFLYKIAQALNATLLAPRFITKKNISKDFKSQLIVDCEQMKQSAV